MKTFYPPSSKSFGLSTFSQATHGRTEFSLELAQRNLLQILLIFSNIPLGTHVNAAQKTRMASSTALIRVNLPALDSHLKLQWEILASILVISQLESSFLYAFGLSQNPRYLKGIPYYLFDKENTVATELFLVWLDLPLLSEICWSLSAFL